MTDRRSTDHDLLIKLETKIDLLVEEIKGLKDTTRKEIDDHEVRLRKIETIDMPGLNTRLAAWSGAIMALQFGIGVALWYFGK